MRFLLFLLLPLLSAGQDIPKHTNTIIVKGVAFPQVVNTLLYKGFSIEQKDDAYQTVKTEFTKEANSFVHISLSVRVKDSTAFITGFYYNQIFTDGQRDHPGSAASPIQYTSLGKKIFARMDDFARMLGAVTYVTR